MIDGVTCNLRIGPDTGLKVFDSEETLLAVQSWKHAHQAVQAARGLVLAEPVRVTPLWLDVRNARSVEIPVLWVYYTIHFSGLSGNEYRVTASLPIESLRPGEERNFALLDAAPWEHVDARLTSSTIEPEATGPDEGADMHSTQEPEGESQAAKEPQSRDVLVVLHCPCGLRLSPANGTLEVSLDSGGSAVFRHPRESEVARLNGLPGLIALVTLKKQKGDLLRAAAEATAITDGILSTAFCATLADVQPGSCQ